MGDRNSKNQFVNTEDIRRNEVYRCALSEQNVLVVDIHEFYDESIMYIIEIFDKTRCNYVRLGITEPKFIKINFLTNE